jgi:hypothetical protein
MCVLGLSLATSDFHPPPLAGGVASSPSHLELGRCEISQLSQSLSRLSIQTMAYNYSNPYAAPSQPQGFAPPRSTFSATQAAGNQRFQVLFSGLPPDVSEKDLRVSLSCNVAVIATGRDGRDRLTGRRSCLLLRFPSLRARLS